MKDGKFVIRMAKMGNSEKIYEITIMDAKDFYWCEKAMEWRPVGKLSLTYVD